MRTGPIDNSFDRICETSRLRHNVDLSQLRDCDYLGFAPPGPDNVANRLGDQRLGSGDACDTVPFAGAAFPEGILRKA
jgi:hypothetical protein